MVWRAIAEVASEVAAAMSVLAIGCGSIDGGWRALADGSCRRAAHRCALVARWISLGGGYRGEGNRLNPLARDSANVARIDARRLLQDRR
jgi:hypothetical protein